MDLAQRLQLTLGDVYTIERELGGGGMSRVFLADERALGRQVVVKLLPPESVGEVSVERFKREIALAAQLQHPHIVPLLTAGDAEGTPYFTMPFIRGESLRSRLAKDGELPINEATRILREVASALAFAHDAGVVHRDIKPENVLLSGGAALVTDFGVAKALRASSGGKSALTSMGVALGTPAYMSPEQASADPLVDHRADIYSWGILAYELMSGQTPFAGRPPQAMLAAHVSETPESVMNRRSSVPAPLGQLIMRCLAKRPADRPQSAAEVVHALDEIATPTGMPPATVASPDTRHRRRSRAFVVAAGIALFAALGVAAGREIVNRRQATGGDTSGRRLAVIPFESPRNDSASGWFADGITDELTAGLGGVPGLRVAPRRATFTYRDSALDARALGRRLSVDWLVLGRARRTGSLIEVFVQLVKTTDGLSTWSRRYVQDIKSIVETEDAMAKDIVAQMKLALSSDRVVVASGTANPQAHELVIRGNYYLFHQRTRKSIARARALFDSAGVMDSNYVAAFAGSALAWSHLADDWLPPSEAMPHMRVALTRAVAIDSMNPDLWNAQAGFAVYERDLRRAEELWRKAFRAKPELLAPSGDYSYYPYPTVLYSLGRIAEADSMIADLIARNPTAPNPLNFAVQFAVTRGQPAQALAFCERLSKLAASEPCQRLQLETAGKLDSALALSRETFRRRVSEGQTANVSAIVIQVDLLSRLGRIDEARRLAESLEAEYSRRYVREDYIVVAYASLGDVVKTLRWLEQGLRSNSWGIGLMYYGLARFPIRKDPRILAFAKRAELGDPPPGWTR